MITLTIDNFSIKTLTTLPMCRITMEQIPLPRTSPCLKTSATLPHPHPAMVFVFVFLYLCFCICICLKTTPSSSNGICIFVFVFVWKPHPHPAIVIVFVFCSFLFVFVWKPAVRYHPSSSNGHLKQCVKCFKWWAIIYMKFVQIS